MRFTLSTGLVALALVAGCAALPDSLDSSLLFRARPADPERLARASRIEGVEEVRIATTDGVTLHGWLKRAPKAAPGERYPLVIVFGGVARETSWMLNWGDKPPEWGWLMVNYRGYGLSGGTPSEHAVVEDAKRIFDYAAARPDVDASRIVVLGRSLGSYVAVTLAASRPLAGAILATPFASIAAVAEERYPFLPMGMLAAGRYDAAAIAPSVRTPALFMIAGTDDVTPPHHGEALARAWGGPKTLHTLENTGHRGVEWRDEYWVRIGRFLRSLEPSASTAKSLSPSG
jgi:pimeloyl-ACP methyl ester carboxylesterase